MKISVLLIVLTFACGCSEIHQRSKSEPCASLFKNIENHWKFDEKQKYFFIKDGSWGVSLIRDRDCFIDLSKRSIKKLFGEPSLEQGNAYFFFLHPTCNGPRGIGANGCSTMDIAFSKDKCRVISFEIGGSGSP